MQKSAIEQAFDPLFDAAWREFAKNQRKKAEPQRKRFFGLLTAIKGNEFVVDVLSLMKKFNCSHHIPNVLRKPIGSRVKDKRWKHIPFIWVQYYPSNRYRDNGNMYKICIQVKENRWISINYYD